MAMENTKIVKPFLILCEGRDAEQFLLNMLKSLFAVNPIFDEFQIFDFGGISQLKVFIETLKNMPGYDLVTAVAIIRDAETDAQGAISSIQHALGSNGLPASLNLGEIASDNGLKTGFVLFPECGTGLKTGTLEDLCLKTLADEGSSVILADVDALLEKRSFARPHKNRLHGYLSLTDKYVALKIGEASKAGAFRFDTPEIVSLKSFLLQFTV